MQELIQKMENSGAWILLTINENEPNTYVFDADFSVNLSREEVDKIIVQLANKD